MQPAEASQKKQREKQGAAGLNLQWIRTLESSLHCSNGHLTIEQLPIAPDNRTLGPEEPTPGNLCSVAVARVDKRAGRNRWLGSLFLGSSSGGQPTNKPLPSKFPQTVLLNSTGLTESAAGADTAGSPVRVADCPSTASPDVQATKPKANQDARSTTIPLDSASQHSSLCASLHHQLTATVAMELQTYKETKRCSVLQHSTPNPAPSILTSSVTHICNGFANTTSHPTPGLTKQYKRKLLPKNGSLYNISRATSSKQTERSSD